MAVNTWALQQAVFAKLQAPLAAMSPSCGLFDHAPVDQSFPFVELSRFIRIPDNYLADDASRYRVTLTVYSQYAGQREVHQILDAISAALDDASLSLSTGVSVRVDLEQCDTSRDGDGRTFMGSAIYSIFVEH